MTVGVLIHRSAATLARSRAAERLDDGLMGDEWPTARAGGDHRSAVPLPRGEGQLAAEWTVWAGFGR